MQDNFSGLLSHHLKQNINITDFGMVSGGCINHCFWIQSALGKWFVKQNTIHFDTMFKSERQGLEIIQKTKTVRVPKVITQFKNQHNSFLILEFIPLKSIHNPQKTAKQLAKMHQNFYEKFGFEKDNFIGLTVQKNHFEKNWCNFFINHRLGFQVQLLKQNSFYNIAKKIEKSLPKIKSILQNHQPQASLVHGDLWSGNIASDEQGNCVLFDPAIYFGDYETDLAMSQLFGALPREFYKSYDDIMPPAKGFETRKAIYNLYHLLNHINLFGESYISQAEKTLDYFF